MKSLTRSLLLLSTALLFSSCVYWTPVSQAPTASATVIPGVPVQKWDILSCGAGALSSVLQRHGDAVTMDEWQESLPKTRGGVMSIDLVLAARQQGFDASLVTGDAGLVEAEIRAGRPVILMLQVIQAPGRSYDFFHYIVIDGYDPQRRLVRAQFGEGRPRWTTMSRIAPAWEKTRFATILIRPPDPNANALRAAVQLEEEGKYALAAHAYREILAADSDSVVAWTNLGNAEMQMQRRPAAEEAFRQAIARDENAADAMNNLAWMLYEDGRHEEAEPLARRAALTQAPDVWMRLDTLGRILLARGSCDEAALTFRQALDALPASRTEQRASLQAASRSTCAAPAVASSER
jgi:PAS domain-containing protein